MSWGTVPTGMMRKECDTCNGRGIIPTPDGRKWQKCPVCDGRGYVLVPIETYWTPYRGALLNL